MNDTNGLGELIRGLISQELDDVHTCLPAKIEKYDAKKLRAEVTPLAKVKINGEMVTMPKEIEMPVVTTLTKNFVIRQPYEKGDTVLVVFSEKAIDNLVIDGKPHDPQLKRRFSTDDGFIIGGFKFDNANDIPVDTDEEEDALYIRNLNVNVKLYITSDGKVRIANDDKQVEIVIETDGVIRIADNTNGTELKFDINAGGNAIFKLANKLFLGSSGASEGAALGTSLKSWLDNHTHPGDSGGTTGAPNSASPDPSSKVFLE